MSHTYSTASSSSQASTNFQLIINNALNAYEKRTKQDLLAHPLAAQLQTCDSPAAILAVLQQQVQGPDQSGNGNDRWTKWLDPTINVLFAFSATVGAGVGLVCPGSFAYYLSSAFSYFWQVFAPANVIFTGIGVLLSVCILRNLASAIVTNIFIRRQKMFVQAKTLL
jgi:hypothetical protein